MAKKQPNIKKLVSLLTGNKKLDQIANVIDKISVKESEQIREIVPTRDWLEDDYYVGTQLLLIAWSFILYRLRNIN